MTDRKVIVCDDHPLFRSGVVHCLNKISGLKVVAEASDVQSAIAKLQIYEPDILVTDLSMPGASGFDLLKYAQEKMPKVQVIVLSMHTELNFVNQAKALGAIGFLAKEDAETNLIHAVNHELGLFYTSDSIGRTELQPIDIKRQADPFVSLFGNVSAAEMRVLSLLSNSMTNKEIAARLNISPRTVEAHRFHLAEKLNAKGPNKLLELAILYRGAIHAKT